MPSPRKGKEKTVVEEINKSDGKREDRKKAQAKQNEDLWKKIQGWYCSAKSFLVPLIKEYSAIAMERTATFLEWLAEKHIERGTSLHITPSQCFNDCDGLQTCNSS